jgi:hypothetical protein
MKGDKNLSEGTQGWLLVETIGGAKTNAATSTSLTPVKDVNPNCM